ncbi:MAG TPA: AAA family ATPase [Longimicrobium sp.]
MNGKRSILSLTLENFLSYGSPAPEIELLPLNVLIGPNASGKSNLIEALVMLRAAQGDFDAAIREGGGAGEYLRKNSAADGFWVEARVSNPSDESILDYSINVEPRDFRPYVKFEEIVRIVDPAGVVLYTQDDGDAAIVRRGGLPSAPPVRVPGLSREQSILSQRRDPELYPELTYLAGLFGRISVFREWRFGSRTKARAPQPADLPVDFLLPDASNLALVLNDMLQRSSIRSRLLGFLQRFYAGAQHISVKLYAGTAQLFIEEAQDVLVPATRLSDGTLRYLSLLAILCHPSPPPIVCIEEPELGLHPDILPTIAELLLDASQRTQLIVTTHSDALVSALSEVPESIVVCEPSDEGTQLRRLDKEALSEWLNRYSLGEIWRMGEIGGTRW